MNEETNALLRELLRWIRASSYSSVQKMIEGEFCKNGNVDAVKARIYQLSDGELTSVAIAKSARVSQSLVSRLWKHWRQIGIAELAGEESRQTRRCFSLSDFGLQVDSTDEEEQENV